MNLIINFTPKTFKEFRAIIIKVNFIKVIILRITNLIKKLTC
jgi:hypothetical protein